MNPFISNYQNVNQTYSYYHYSSNPYVSNISAQTNHNQWQNPSIIGKITDSIYYGFENNTDYQKQIKIQQQERQTIPTGTQKIQAKVFVKKEQYIHNKQSLKLIQQKRVKQQKSQNIFKNAYLSFIFNKILIFIRNKNQSQKFLKDIFKKINLDFSKEIDSFKDYVELLGQKIINKVSIQKIRQFWIGTSSINLNSSLNIQQKKLFHLCLRLLSKIYLQKFYGNYVMRSKKIKKNLRINHLKMRRCLLKNLKSPKQFKSYRYF